MVEREAANAASGCARINFRGVRPVYVSPPSTRLIAAISSAGLTGFIRKS